MTLQEQLKDAEPIFKRIAECVSKGNFPQAYEIIHNENPPQSWIIELDSRARKGEK